MGNVELVKRITAAFCENRNDKEILGRYFSDDFEHVMNGKRSGLGQYASHLAHYGGEYESFSIPVWDDIIEAGDKVVTSYVLEAKKKGGGTDRSAVMAIWQIKDGKVAALREVDAPL